MAERRLFALFDRRAHTRSPEGHLAGDRLADSQPTWTEDTDDDELPPGLTTAILQSPAPWTTGEPLRVPSGPRSFPSFIALLLSWRMKAR